MASAQLFIEVPFHQKERAKSAGARWDGAMGKWYVPHGLDVNAFKEWWPAVLLTNMAKLHDKKPAKKRSKARKTKTA